MTSFSAFVIHSDAGGELRNMSLDQLDAGEVLIRTAWSGINYKDALAGLGQGRIVRRYPCVGGIDVSGVVESSSNALFKAGDRVLVTGFDFGVSHHGGYAEWARVPAQWVRHCPPGLDLRQVMVLGTAGFTAGVAVHDLLGAGLEPGAEVAVNGATGGVSSVAISILAELGYAVSAITSKTNADGYLQQLGATAVLHPDQLNYPGKALEKERWGGSCDALGGPALAYLIASSRIHAPVACYGNALSAKLETTVFPFILRGVKLLGTDSVYATGATRNHVWAKLASDWSRWRQLGDSLVSDEVSLSELPQVFTKLHSAQHIGRTLLRLSGER